MKSSLLTHLFCLLCCMLLITTAQAHTDSLPDPPRVVDSTTLKKSPAQAVEVLEVFNKNHRDSLSERHGMASIGDLIVIRVSNIDSLIRRSQCKNADGSLIPGCSPQPISLFINGRMINSIEPVSGAPKLDSSGNGELQYELQRNGENDKVWAELLGSPPLFSKRTFIEPVLVGIGLRNDYQLPVRTIGKTNFKIERIHSFWFWTCLGAVVLYLLIVFVFMNTTGLLRDRHMDLSSIGIGPSANLPPYSLGRFQMAFWFTLFVMSFLFIWLITDAYDIITASVLGLIGISAGTSLSALVIDNSKKQELLTQTQAKMAALAQLPPGDPGRVQLQQEIDSNLLEIRPPSRGFWKDILNDVNGASFHRLQMFAWTLVLGLLFIFSVWKRLSMPDFDPTLLALQGLTAGTYLGFKFPERTT